MFVVKRDGRKEPVHFDKVTNRIEKLCYGLQHVDARVVAQKVCSGIYPGVSTVELDELAAETSAQMAATDPEYGTLAGRIAISNIHKETSKCFSKVIETLWDYTDEIRGTKHSLISSSVHDFVVANADLLNGHIVHERDFTYSYFAVKTLEKAYLQKVNKKTVERPQHMLMRVACGIWCGNIAKVLKTYEFMSKKMFTHASPTLFNAGTKMPSLSSCFLLTIQKDSIDGIFDTLKQCAHISKHAGGIGLALSSVRAEGSYIRSTNGYSDGIVPMCRVFNNTARYINQSQKRKGAFAVYLEPWHADILAFLDLRKPQGAEEFRARDLFYGLWIPDLFMDRVEKDQDWCLMCPDSSPGLQNVWGDEFVTLYEQYERDGLFKTRLKARQIWAAIIDSQQETGTPYLLYKDACNRKSNQKNLGTIKSSNLCTEIVEYTSDDEVAVCNLGSIALPMYVDSSTQTFDHQKLYDVAYMLTENLNQVIDVNYYPVPESKTSNMRHRPIAVGVQGLADVFVKMRYPYESKEAAKLNKDIFETIYFACLSASKDLAKQFGPYSSFQGSPASKGQLQFDLWNVVPDSERWNWSQLKQDIVQFGLRNSLVTAPMPTATTAHILGNTESFEPLSNNLYVRRTMAGEFIVINDMLVRDLDKLGLWDSTMKQKIILHSGSVQSIPEIPTNLKTLYKTVWEMKMKTLIDMAADRGPYIDQSQSFNCYMADPDYSKLTSMHFYGYKKGLKTGMYYLRADPPSKAIKFTVETPKEVEKQNEPMEYTFAEKLLCSLKNPEECEACGS